MSDIEYLRLEDLLGFVRRLEIGPVKDLGLLDSAVVRPMSNAFGEDAYATLTLKAAALLHSIVTNHALVDGNKPLGWLATTVFMDTNGEPIQLADDDAFELVMAIAEGRLDVEDIAAKITPRPTAPQH